MHRVLVVAYSFPPINEPAALRVAGFCRYLPDFGWDPVVLAPANGLGRGYGLSAPGGAEEWRVPDPDPVKALARCWQGAPAGPGAQRPAGGGRWFGRLIRTAYQTALFPDRDILWAARAARFALGRLRGRPDIRAVVSSAPGASTHWAAARISRRTGLPWVPVFHDVWAGDTRAERPRTRIRAWLERRLESGMCRDARRVVTVTEGCAQRLCCAAERISVIRGGFEPEHYRDLPPPPAAGRFRIAHAGTLYGGLRDPTGLFRAIRLLADRGEVPREDLELLLIGPADPAVTARARADGVEDLVRFTGQVPHRHALELLAASHLLVALTTPSGHELPTKVFEYLAIGRPVLALWRTDAELARLVRTARAGHTCPPEQVECAARFLGGRYRAWRDGAPLPQPDPAVLGGLTYRAGAAQLAGILDQVTA